MRIVVMPPLDREFFGGIGGFDIAAPNLFALVAALDQRAPGFADIADVRTAFAIDGVYAADWSAPLADAAEVIVLPRVGGGQGGRRWP